MTTESTLFPADADPPPIVCLARIDATDFPSVELLVRRHERRGRKATRAGRRSPPHGPASSPAPTPR